MCVIYNCGTPKQKEEISAFIEDGVELPGVEDVLYDTSTPSVPWILILVARQDQVSVRRATHDDRLEVSVTKRARLDGNQQKNDRINNHS